MTVRESDVTLLSICEGKKGVFLLVAANLLHLRLAYFEATGRTECP